MVNRPDDVPALSEIPDDETLPDWWTEKTTITVDRWTKKMLDDNRDGKPWTQYLYQLQRDHNDPLTLTRVDAIAERVAEQLDDNSGDVTLEASERRAIAEEVAEVLGR